MKKIEPTFFYAIHHVEDGEFYINGFHFLNGL